WCSEARPWMLTAVAAPWLFFWRRIAEVAQERRVRLDDQHTPAILQRRPVGRKAAVKREELRILAVRMRVDGRRLRVALALHLGGIAIGIGLQHLRLAIRVGLDPGRRLLPGVAQFVGQLQPLGTHPLVHRFADLVGQVDPLDAHIDHGDAKVLSRRRVGLGAYPLGDVLAPARDQVGQGARVELEAQRVLHDRRQPLRRLQLVAASGTVIHGVVDDAPLDVEVDVDALLLGGEVALRRRVQRQDALVEMDHLLDHRQLEMQPRLVIGLHDAAELQQQRTVALADHEHAAQAEQDQHDGDDGGEDPVHHCAPLSVVLLADAGAGTIAPAWAAPTSPEEPCTEGRLMMLRPSEPSITLVLCSITCSMVSSHSRLRVTSGAALYWASSRSKRAVSPWARAIRSALSPAASAAIRAASPRATGTTLL